MNSPKTDQTTYNVHNSLQISNYYYVKEIHVFNKLTNTQYNNKEKKVVLVILHGWGTETSWMISLPSPW